MTLKMIDPAQAASLYQKTAIAASKEESGESGGSGSSGGVSFSSFLEKSVSDVIDVVKEGEKMSARAVTGQADLADVVQALTDAELSLQTVVAVRDRMISAYQEIMRMPI